MTGCANVEHPERPLSRSISLGDASTFILNPPRQEPPVVGRFDKEQEYEGTVVAVDPLNDAFTARLVDLTGEAPDEEGEFSFNEVAEDKHLVVPGALFSWVIGLQWRRRTATRVSEVRFRRLPPFSADAIAEAEARASQLAELFAGQDDAAVHTSSK